MSKIPLFLPTFKALIKGKLFVPESQGPNHPVFYFEDDHWIYFYKPVGSFVYCLELFKVLEESNEGSLSLGKTQQEIDELKKEFDAEEVPRMLYVTHIETTTTGVHRQ